MTVGWLEVSCTASLLHVLELSLKYMRASHCLLHEVPKNIHRHCHFFLKIIKNKYVFIPLTITAKSGPRS